MKNYFLEDYLKLKKEYHRRLFSMLKIMDQMQPQKPSNEELTKKTAVNNDPI